MNRLTALVFLLFAAAHAPAQEPATQELDSARQQYQALYGQRRYQESLPHAERVYEIAAATLPSSDPGRALALYNYGDNLLKARQFRDSVDKLEDALKAYERVYGKDAIELVPVILTLAQADRRPPKLIPKKRYLKRVRQIVTGHFPAGSVELADALTSVGRVAVDAGDPQDLDAALAIYGEQLGPEHFKTGTAQFLLGQLYINTEEHDEAEQALLAALESFDPEELGNMRANTAVRRVLFRLYDAQGRDANATAQAVEIGRNIARHPGQPFPPPLVRVQPVPPPVVRTNNLSGHVDLKLTVDAEGRVVDPEVVNLEGHPSMARAAKAAVLKYRYVPTIRDGEPVAQPGVTARVWFNARRR